MRFWSTRERKPEIRRTHEAYLEGTESLRKGCIMVAAAAGFKRIITKAVYGRRSSTLTRQVELPIGGEPRPVAVLGQVVANPRIISAEVTGFGAARTVRVTGGLDLHIWYRTQEDTRVARMPVQFTEEILVRPAGNEPFRELTATARVVGRPECTEVALLGTSATGRAFRAEVKLDLEVEVIGVTELDILLGSKADTPTTAGASPNAEGYAPSSIGPAAAPPVAPVDPLVVKAVDEDDDVDD